MSSIRSANKNQLKVLDFGVLSEEYLIKSCLFYGYNPENGCLLYSKVTSSEYQTLI